MFQRIVNCIRHRGVLRGEDRQRDYQRVFGTSEGQRVLEDLCNRCGLGSPSFHQESERQTIYNLGRRSVVLDILNAIEGVKG